MKKIILLAIIAILATGCKGNFMEEVKFTKGEPQLRGLSVFEYDSCEYILVYKSVAHKGNCKYCKQRRENELQKTDSTTKVRYTRIIQVCEK